MTANAAAPNTGLLPEPPPYVSERYVPTPQKPTKVLRRQKAYLNHLGQCSCVEYVKYRLGFVGTFGNAKDVQPTSEVPRAGSVILFGNHVGYITWVDVVSGLIQYDDYNFISCTERRGVIVKMGDPSIRGYTDGN